jgi:hypothetical protein
MTPFALPIDVPAILRETGRKLAQLFVQAIDIKLLGKALS